jgi:hypothetical protein
VSIDELIAKAVAEETQGLRRDVDRRLAEITEIFRTLRPERNPNERLKLHAAASEYGIPVELLRKAAKEGYISSEPQCPGNDNLFLFRRRDLDSFDLNSLLGLPPKRQKR